MPLARIEIEQLAHDRWHVEFEGVGISANRKLFNGTSFDDVMAWLIEEYSARAPAPAIPKVGDAPLEPQPAIPRPIGKIGASEARDEADEAAKRKAALVADARAAGVDVDLRWGEERLRREIDERRAAA